MAQRDKRLKQITNVGTKIYSKMAKPLNNINDPRNIKRRVKILFKITVFKDLCVHSLHKVEEEQQQKQNKTKKKK